MTTLMQQFRERMATTLATTPKEELAQPDKKKNFFSEPGIYEVYANGAEVKTSKAGKEYLSVNITAPDGKSDDILLSTRDKDGNPNLVKMQMYLRGFGIVTTQKIIGCFFDLFESNLDKFLKGHVEARLSYYGFMPDYVEKGVYCLRDYGKGAPPYPDNKMIDPVNNDVLAFQTREEAVTYLTSKGWKVGGKNWDFIKPAANFEMSEEQKQVAEMIESMLSDEPPPPPVEEKKPAKPAWLANKK